MPPKKSELPGSPKIQELDEDKADEPSLPPMTPESKQLAAVIATAVATAMAGKSASPDSSSSMVRYSAGVSLASRTRSIINIVRNLKLHLATLPGAPGEPCRCREATASAGQQGQPPQLKPPRQPPRPKEQARKAPDRLSRLQQLLRSSAARLGAGPQPPGSGKRRGAGCGGRTRTSLPSRQVL